MNYTKLQLDQKINWINVQLRHALHAEDFEDFDRLSKQKDELVKMREEAKQRELQEKSSSVETG